MTEGTPAAPPVLPMAQMQELLGMLKAIEDEATRAHALHWLVFQQYQHNPLMWQFTWQEAWHVHAYIALKGLLEMAVQEGRISPELLTAIAGAMNNMYGAHQTATRTWRRFLQTAPAAANQPAVKAFNDRLAVLDAAQQKQMQTATQIHRAIMQAVPVPDRA